MSCNNGCNPISSIVKELLGSAIVLNDDSTWSDGFVNDTFRKGLWNIYVDGVKVVDGVMGFSFADYAVGQGSTNFQIVLANGVQDVIDYLIGLGIAADANSQIGFSRIVTNACGNESEESEICAITAPNGNPIPSYLYPLVIAGFLPLTAPLSEDHIEKASTGPTVNVGDPACPVDYSTYQFDLSPFGGATDEMFADVSELLDRMQDLNDAGGQPYTFIVASCAVKVVSETPPAVDSRDIDVYVPQQLVLYSFPVVDNGFASCPIDYTVTRFDLTVFGGAIGELFPDETALLARMELLNDAGGVAYTFNTADCAVEVCSTTPPAVTSGEIETDSGASPIIYTFNIEDGGATACPIDFANTSFDLTPFGGGGSEMLVDGVALAARMDILNPAGTDTYTYDGTACTISVNTATAPSVITGIIEVQVNPVLTTYSFPVLDGGATACPIDYNATSFDLTLFGGGSTDVFANESELLARVQTLNNAAGNSYTFNATTCAIEVMSSSAPPVTSGNINVNGAATIVTYSFALIESGAMACPVDYTTAVFDMSPFGGGTSATFTSEAQLLSTLDLLNDADNQPYTFNSTTCAVEVRSVTPPANTGATIQVNPVSVSYSFPVLDLLGANACPINYGVSTFNLTPFGGPANAGAANDAGLANLVETLNPAGSAQYTFNTTTCAVEVNSSTPPAVTTANIVATYPVTLTFPVLNGGAAACPIDYANTSFDLTLFGGGAAESFVDEAALLTRIDTLNPAGGNTYSLNATTCAVEVTTDALPTVTTGNINVTVSATTYTFPLICNYDLDLLSDPDAGTVENSSAWIYTPIQDVEVTSITQDQIGALFSPTVTRKLLIKTGGINGTIVGSSDLITYIASGGIQTYPFTTPVSLTVGTTYHIVFADNADNTVSTITGDSVKRTTGPSDTLNEILENGSGTPDKVIVRIQGNCTTCPIDYANTTFDLTPFSGGAAESFVNEAALLAQMGTLNPVGAIAYTFNAGTCAVEVTSSTPPVVTTADIVVDVVIPYDLDILSGDASIFTNAVTNGITFNLNVDVNLTDITLIVVSVFGGETGILLEVRTGLDPNAGTVIATSTNTNDISTESNHTWQIPSTLITAGSDYVIRLAGVSPITNLKVGAFDVDSRIGHYTSGANTPNDAPVRLQGTVA